MANKRLEQSLIHLITKFQDQSINIQEMAQYKDKDAKIPEWKIFLKKFSASFKFNEIKSYFPMIRAIVFVLLERELEIPYYPQILDQIKENFLKMMKSLK